MKINQKPIKIIEREREKINLKIRRLEEINKKLIDLAENNGDIVGGPFGSNLKTSDYVDKGVPIIRLQNIERYRFITDNLMYTSEEKYNELKYHSFKGKMENQLNITFNKVEKL